MKTKLLLFGLLIYSSFSFSQDSNSTFLTWMKGDNTINQVGVYGIQGTSAASNKPGARDFSATWKDNNGHLWLFGGYGYDNSNLGYLNDLWKYNPSNNQWIWVKGDNTIEQNATCGTQGVAHAANKPGAIYASISWSDNSGNLWLFGGFGYTDTEFGFLNTLWKFTPSTNKWTWVKGDKTTNQAGIYGSQGIAHASNKPGGRYGSRTWTDSNGNLWLFGGFGLDNSGTNGNLNDLWKYDPPSNQWTWVKGDNVVDKPGVYGAQGIPDDANNPGARYVSVSWTDNSNNLWLFGGSGFNGSTQGSLNDLWKYTVSTNQWTWIKGDSMINRPGVYGTQGQADINNRPGARYVSVSWTDNSNNLWLFGGYGYAAGTEGYLNDLWKYDAILNKWSWVKGDNTIDQLAVYGTQGMPSALNKSGARTSCVSWTGGAGDLWLFGGYGYDAASSGILNDLWKISSIGAVLPLQLFHFSGNLNDDVVRLKWHTAQELNFSHFTVQRSFDGSNFSDLGSVNSRGTLYRTEYNFDDNDLRNHPELKVFYRLQLADKDGHVTYSKTLRFDRIQASLALHLFPNPASHTLNVSFDQSQPGQSLIQITDMNGRIILKQPEQVSTGRVSITVDVRALPAATYILSVTNASGITQQKFVKQ
jgi:N-acetylneuraminic acid mutarotase